MSTKDRIVSDLKAAMLAKDELARDTLRMLKADIMNREVELGRDLSEDETTAVLQKAVKSRRDAISSYEEGGRADAADKERRENRRRRAVSPEAARRSCHSRGDRSARGRARIVRQEGSRSRDEGAQGAPRRRGRRQARVQDRRRRARLAELGNGLGDHDRSVALDVRDFGLLTDCRPSNLESDTPA